MRVRPNRALQSTLIRIDEGRLGLHARAISRPASTAPPLLIVHGATLGASLFDLPLEGYSLLAELAQLGRSVYAVDIRGYGTSLSGGIMDTAPDRNPPYARLHDAVADVSRAVQFILNREGGHAVDLVGFSWGTVVSAHFASVFPASVARLVLYAPLFGEHNPLWTERIGAPGNRFLLHPEIGAYRLVSEADLTQRWDADIGTASIAAYREPHVPKVIFDTFARLDPRAASRSPAAFRAPNGALADLIGVFNGTPLYDPGSITMPTLLIRGADDTTSTDTDARRLLGLLAATEKTYTIVPQGSHFLCVEKHRHELYLALKSFLGETSLA